MGHSNAFPVRKDLRRILATLYFCNGENCRRNGSEELTQAVRSCLAKEGMDSDFHTIKTLCAGFCEEAPVIAVQPENIWYGGLNSTTAFPVLKKHLFGGSLDRSSIFHPCEVENE